MMNGILNVYKPGGLSSHAVVSRIRKFTDTRRVGHAGTLDPMACGVLPMLVGNAAAVQEKLMEHDKTYVAGVQFGKCTDTGDITGKVLAEHEVTFTEEALQKTLASFVGELEQVPPMYSAIQVGGVKLYKLARKGVEIARQSRKIRIDAIRTVSNFDGKRVVLEVACSKGTYIRTLAEDIGSALGCGATLDYLERSVCGAFRKEDAVTLEELEELFHAGKADEIQGKMQSPEMLFEDLPTVRMTDFYRRLSLNGCEIYLKKAHIPRGIFENTDMCRLYDEQGAFYAVAQLKSYENGEAVKVVYRFV